MTHNEILDFKYRFEDANANSLREYFKALLEVLWNEGEGFSGKRPFGNSGWDYDVYCALAEAKIIKGVKHIAFDYTGKIAYTEWNDLDKAAANKLVPKLIATMCGVGPNE